jgi:alpha-galactosidase
MSFRHHVAMAGNFGYELDITKFSAEDKKLIKEQVAMYKSIRKLVQYGDLYRLLSPFEGNYTSFLYVSEDKREAVWFLYRVMNVPNSPLFRFRLEGMNKDYNYKVSGTELVIKGDQLMNYGMKEPKEFGWGDFNSNVIHLKAI